ncbi:hypothetical protein [Arcanobacterium phocae]|uniref:hypothetical protein n=1 Tax=Arcanobacterium phocae TaxID=131112 RepID=UPI001C0F10D9|nr:hypothetical protein [Arcanobacterium phocae]
MTNQQLWGIHNDTLFDKLIEEGFISIGWEKIGDLRFIANDQVKMREAIKRAFSAEKPSAFPLWAGVFRRFAFETQVGDLVFCDCSANI